MKTERPSLFRKCKNCLIASRVIKSEIENPTLIDYREKFISTKIEIECDVEDDGPQHRVFMTRWHEGRFGDDEQTKRREGKSGEVRCPHFENEWL